MRHITFGKNFKPITNIGKYDIHGKRHKPKIIFESKLRLKPLNRSVYPPYKPANYKKYNKYKGAK